MIHTDIAVDPGTRDWKFPPLRGALVGFLDDLFVQPEARGQGVVDALYDALNQLGKEQGWPFIRWITAENTPRSRGLRQTLRKNSLDYLPERDRVGSPLLSD
jgi:hypothetical protein